MMPTRSVWKGAAAGTVAGFAASWLMNQFQAAATKLKADNKEDEQKEQGSEDATMKAAAAIADALRIDLTKERKKQLGPVVHYAFGTSMGALFGVMTELYPSTKAGWGTAFATALFVGADELAVPLFGLGSSPTQTPLSSHLFAWASHLVYGTGTESVRRIIRSAIGKPTSRLSQSRATSHAQRSLVA